ncbi:MAG: DinB family protein [bacterium]
MRALPQQIAAYCAWLRGHGEPIRQPRSVRVKILERHQVRAGMRWGGYDVLHTFERRRVTPEEVARALRWMGILRSETMAFVDALPREALQWTSPGQARTIKRHLQHIAGAERWYLQRLALGPFPDLGRTRDPVERLVRVRTLVGWRLLRLSPEERARIVRTDGKWWSARKMLGRFLYHERYHIRSMARIARYHAAPVPQRLAGWARY